MKKSQQRELIEIVDEASTLMSSGDFDEARNLFEYVRAALGDNGATVVRHGADQYSLAEILNFILACDQPAENWSDMVSVAEELCALTPDESDPWIRLAIGLKHTGNMPRANEAVVRAIRADDSDSNAYYEHACQLAVMGQTEAALDRVADAMANGADANDLKRDAELASLWELPRFKELTAKKRR